MQINNNVDFNLELYVGNFEQVKRFVEMVAIFFVYCWKRNIQSGYSNLTASNVVALPPGSMYAM